MKAPVTKREAIETIAELEEIVAGAELVEKNLMHYLTRICALIYYQAPLEDQDLFLAEMIDIGLYEVPEDGI
tara:strand:+ start:201 stop:416 length:216 start_codon:yes stop_codon:yes gene_type:complete